MNDTAEYNSVLRSASDVAALKVRHRDAVRRNDDAAHDLHEVRRRLSRWAGAQALTPFLAVGVAVVSVVLGLVLAAVVPSGSFNAGGFVVLAVGAPAGAGALLFWVSSHVVAGLRRQAMLARSAVNLAERDLLVAGEDVTAAVNGFWARKRPSAA